MALTSSYPPFPHDFDENSWADGPEHWRTSFRLGTADLEIVEWERTNTSRRGLALELGCARHFDAVVRELNAMPDVVRQ